MTPLMPAARRATLAALLLGLTGCAAFWDDVTSREFQVGELFSKPDPLVVIRDSTDGERRARALASLTEPATSGGTAQQQDFYLDVLGRSAKEDREPLCRLGAIQALGKFKDPRAARVLEDVYQQPKLPFTQEFNAMIRQQALRGLERTGDPEARHLLIRVARQPSPARDASSTDRQQTQDEKIIAIRALGRYREPECLETLVHLLETERDIALRDRAHTSLQEATGRNAPADPQAWRAALAGQPVVAPEPGFIQRVTGWLN